jgi:hypothetical protein
VSERTKADLTLVDVWICAVQECPGLDPIWCMLKIMDLFTIFVLNNDDVIRKMIPYRSDDD